MATHWPRPAPRVVATATATPSHTIGPGETKSYLRQAFGAAYPDLARAERMVDHTQIQTRYLALPPDTLIAERRLERKNACYAETVRQLGCSVAERALEDAGIPATSVDLVVTVSCTGYMIPSLDVHLAGQLGMRASVRRLPVTELGCGGGTAGLALATDYVRAHPGSTALLVSAELCSLTFQPLDASWQNVVAAMLFGDGAAAAVVTDRAARAGPAILDTRSHLFPDTLDYMGFVLKDSGFHLVMSPQVPEMVRRSFRPLLEDFLHDNGLQQDDLHFYVLHPGGAKILRYLRQHVGVPERWLAPSADVLRRYGNTSSASVLFVLDDVMRHHHPDPGAFGVMASLGPGFCAEMLLLRWED
ncbi:MAG TPA: type III polyketide synthase [Chloroflexota bacterium]|nr:type III polyketide synthase [Chloroflexota bacterium]